MLGRPPTPRQRLRCGSGDRAAGCGMAAAGGGVNDASCGAPNAAMTAALDQDVNDGTELPVGSLRTILDSDELDVAHEDEVYDFLRELSPGITGGASASASIDADVANATSSCAGAIAAASSDAGSGGSGLWDVCRFAKLSPDKAFEAMTCSTLPVPATTIALSRALEEIRSASGEEACEKRLNELPEEQRSLIKRRRLSPRRPMTWEHSDGVRCEPQSGRRTRLVAFGSTRGYAVLNAAVPPVGQVTWRFTVEEDNFNSNGTCVGVSERPVRGTYEGDTSFIVLRSYTGQVERAGSTGERLGGSSGLLITRPMDVLVTVDFAAGTVAFKAGDVGPKVLFRGLRGPVYPAVFFYKRGAIVFHGQHRAGPPAL
eukprot:TRINITY_DN9459_c1_g1_i1.p1 TRINITY_DN9459_c1_g1~~TRINITY_DN9459_c1_g1_i1.p1  ORF type:complete len:372 (+),score=94.26 TRINITY_DN9459_c1_g1_i1:629-1744(+)